MPLRRQIARGTGQLPLLQKRWGALLLSGALILSLAETTNHPTACSSKGSAQTFAMEASCMRKRNQRPELTGTRSGVWDQFLPLSQWTDERLVEAAQAGNQDAFAELVRRYQAKIYNLALRYINDSETAMDIAQDAFVRAWQKLPKFRGEASFYTWLYRITMNLCIDRHRRALVRGEPQKVSLEDLMVERFRFEETEEEEGLWWEESEASEPEAEVLRQEMRQKVWEAVQQLPPLLRQVILLREYEGLSLQEIAKIVGANVGTIKSRLYQARQHLKRLLAPYFNG
ncbi:MAG: hypothetical protein C4295_11290 [Candidatus Fervidibacterota bacterium]